MSYKIMKEYDPDGEEIGEHVRHLDEKNITTLIPYNEDNYLYQEYLAWVAKGNTAEPAD